LILYDLKYVKCLKGKCALKIVRVLFRHSSLGLKKVFSIMKLKAL